MMHSALSLNPTEPNSVHHQAKFARGKQRKATVLKYWHSEKDMKTSVAKKTLNLSRSTFKQPTARWKKAVGHDHILQLQCYGSRGNAGDAKGGKEGEPAVLSLAVDSAEEYARWVDALSVYSSGEATAGARNNSRSVDAASGR